ncbi:hypothetical protein QJS10_CPA05g00491 [Acorus calamus]|uniref:CW-type domain-containing protein n=1 Tax=Acorus calamus TaxID=4465 RepID=A0AAV9ES61_ACOCL|nr:hypothetical protein QJS10_CPA05g00491 [Acorus calamus]
MMPELCDSPNESPTVIIRIMTTFPIFGGSMLSPLTNSLLCLLEKEKYSSNDGKTVAVQRSSFETSVVPDTLSPMRKEKNSNFKRLKPVEKTGPHALMDLSSKNGENDIGSPLKKDTNEKNEWQKIGETARNFNRASDSIRQSNKVVVKDQMSSPVSIKDEMLEAVGIVDVSDRPVRNVPLCKGTKNSKPGLVEKVWEEKKTSTYKDLLSDPEKEDRNRVDRNCDVLKTNSEGFNNKDQTNALIESVKQKTMDPLYVGQKKVKGSHLSGNALMEFSKEGSMVGGVVLQDKKTGHVKSCPSENMSEFSKAQRESYRNSDKEQGDFPGCIKAEQVENRVGLLEGSFKNKAKDPQLGIEKETPPFSEKPKERVGGKKGKVSLAAEVCGKVYIKASNLGVDPLTGTAIPPTCPVVIEENWVQCENCNKWRLLPFGSKTESLPKKWLCIMLDWLPGMNSCSVSEEETTKALNALYQIPLHESQTTIHGTSGLTLADGGNLDQLQPSMHPMPVVAKKKSRSKDSSIAPSQNQLPNSVKKSQPVSFKCRSLNDVNQHPPYSIISSKDASQQSSKSNDLFSGKRGHKSKDKHKSLGHFSDGGNITGSSKQSKSKGKWETEQESMRASKKIRLDGLRHTDEDWHSENGSTGKVVLNSCNSLQAKVNGENIHKFNEKSSVKGFIEGESRDDSLPAGKKMSAQSQVTSNGAIEVSEMDLAARKRKVKEFKSDQVYPETFLGNRHLPDDMSFEKVEIKEIESRKEKKSRLSKTDHKEAKANKAAGRKDKKVRVNKISLSDSRGLFLGGTGAEKRDCAEKELQMEKDQNNAVSQRTMDVLDPLRRDLGYAPSLTTATSSSSKVSGSHKSKGNFQEVRGSPVESVSSSPLRISNTDKITSKRIFFVKDESTMAFSTVGSPKRLSDGEAEGGSDQSKTSKAKANSIFLHETMNGDGEAAVLGSFRGALHYQEMDTNQISSTKAREEVRLQACSGTHGIHFPSEFSNVNVENGGGKTSGQITQHEHDGNKNCLSQEKRDSYYHVNESSQLKSKSNNLCSKDRHKSVKPDVESGRVKASDPFGGHEDNYFSKNANGFRCGSDIESRGCFPYHEEKREKSSNIPVKDQKNYLGEKITVGNTSSEGGKDGLPIVGTHEDSLQGSPLLTKKYSNFTCAKDLKNVPESLHLVSIRGDENSAKNLLLDRAVKLSWHQGEESLSHLHILEISRKGKIKEAE